MSESEDEHHKTNGRVQEDIKNLTEEESVELSSV